MQSGLNALVFNIILYEQLSVELIRHGSTEKVGTNQEIWGVRRSDLTIVISLSYLTPYCSTSPHKGRQIDCALYHVGGRNRCDTIIIKITEQHRSRCCCVIDRIIGQESHLDRAKWCVLLARVK